MTGKAVHAKTKEQHINTKIKYKNTTQDKNRGTSAVVWLKANTAIPKSMILIQKF